MLNIKLLETGLQLRIFGSLIFTPHNISFVCPNSRFHVIMGPKKGGSSKKGKGKAQSPADSDTEYFPEDLHFFEDPPEFTLHSPLSKKRKGETTTSLFVNAAAQKQWEDGICVKKLHLERAFTVDKGHFKKLMKFHRFNEKLTMVPEFCNVSLAREYYANAKFPNDKGAIFVRGKGIDIISEIVNTHLGTPSFPTDPLQYLHSEEDDQALLDELAHPGAEWV